MERVAVVAFVAAVVLLAGGVAAQDFSSSAASTTTTTVTVPVSSDPATLSAAATSHARIAEEYLARIAQLQQGLAADERTAAGNARASRTYMSAARTGIRTQGTLQREKTRSSKIVEIESNEQRRLQTVMRSEGDRREQSLAKAEAEQEKERDLRAKAQGELDKGAREKAEAAKYEGKRIAEGGQELRTRAKLRNSEANEQLARSQLREQSGELRSDTSKQATLRTEIARLRGEVEQLTKQLGSLKTDEAKADASAFAGKQQLERDGFRMSKTERALSEDNVNLRRAQLATQQSQASAQQAQQQMEIEKNKEKAAAAEVQSVERREEDMLRKKEQLKEQEQHDHVQAQRFSTQAEAAGEESNKYEQDKAESRARATVLSEKVDGEIKDARRDNNDALAEQRKAEAVGPNSGKGMEYSMEAANDKRDADRLLGQAKRDERREARNKAKYERSLSEENSYQREQKKLRNEATEYDNKAAQLKNQEGDIDTRLGMVPAERRAAEDTERTHRELAMRDEARDFRAKRNYASASRKEREAESDKQHNEEKLKQEQASSAAAAAQYNAGSQRKTQDEIRIEDLRAKRAAAEGQLRSKESELNALERMIQRGERTSSLDNARISKDQTEIDLLKKKEAAYSSEKSAAEQGKRSADSQYMQTTESALKANREAAAASAAAQSAKDDERRFETLERNTATAIDGQADPMRFGDIESRIEAKKLDIARNEQRMSELSRNNVQLQLEMRNVNEQIASFKTLAARHMTLARNFYKQYQESLKLQALKQEQRARATPARISYVQ